MRSSLSLMGSRLSLATAQEVARSRGGWCVSEKYLGVKRHLTWRCVESHEWRATLDSIRNGGTWCPFCAMDKRKLTLNEAIHAAASRDGFCLSIGYSNTKIPLRWRCAEGHEWNATFNTIRQGAWCPHCRPDRTCGIEVARETARLRNGLCLSTHYVNNHSHLWWQCDKGHEWTASLKNVKIGQTWCPHCAAGRNEKEVRDIFEHTFCGQSFPTCRPAFLVGHRGRALELDGYCATLGLAFEYNGEQHYHAEMYWNRRRTGGFAKIVANDRLKAALCEACGVKLVIVPYMVKDRWTFIRLCLLRWFPVGRIFPVTLAE